MGLYIANCEKMNYKGKYSSIKLIMRLVNYYAPKLTNLLILTNKLRSFA